MQLKYLAFLLVLMPFLVSADFGYNVFNDTCKMDGTGGGGRNGFVLGNIGYGGCWVNDTTSGIVFTPCNPGNSYKYAKTWEDSSILFTPFYQGQSVVGNPAWNCYDWIAVDTNAIETGTGDLEIGRQCDPNNIGTFKGGQLQYNLDCGFAGGNLTHNTTQTCGGTLTCDNYTNGGLGFGGCENVWGEGCRWDWNPISATFMHCINKNIQGCSLIPYSACVKYSSLWSPPGGCTLSLPPVNVDCNDSTLNASSPQARLHCAPIDCEPLMLSSTLYSTPNGNGANTQNYYCRDFLVYLKQLTASRTVKQDNAGNVWNQQTLNNYFTQVNPGLYTFAYDQYYTGWVHASLNMFGLFFFNYTTQFLTPTNINYELSALCINGNDSTGHQYTYDTFLNSNFSNEGEKATMIGDWYPLHIDMPPNTPVYNGTSLGAVLGNMGTQLSLQWNVDTATTSDTNICINKASYWNTMQEFPGQFLKNPALALTSLLPDNLKDMVSLISVMLDFMFCGIIIWFLTHVMGAWLELRKWMYAKKYFLIVTPAVRYIAWATGSLIAFSVILNNELAFKTAVIFAGLHTFLGVGTSSILDLAVTTTASVILGFLPAYFYKVALILATLLIGISVIVLLYDAYFVYLKPLAYPKYKM